MKGFKITRNMINGKLVRDLDITAFVYNQEVVRNNIEARCRILKGELPYNTTIGLPLKVNKEIIDLAISNIVNTTIGVRRILNNSSLMDNRTYRSKLRIDTIFNTNIEVSINE